MTKAILVYCSIGFMSEQTTYRLGLTFHTDEERSRQYQVHYHGRAGVTPGLSETYPSNRAEFSKELNRCPTRIVVIYWLKLTRFPLWIRDVYDSAKISTSTVAVAAIVAWPLWNRQSLHDGISGGDLNWRGGGGNSTKYNQCLLASTR
jgi:hypothetical protein